MFCVSFFSEFSSFGANAGAEESLPLVVIVGHVVHIFCHYQTPWARECPSVLDVETNVRD